jgi:dipeptidase E
MRAPPAGQIVAMGGGSFSKEPISFLLDEFVLSLARTTPARVCFLPTASGESTAYIAQFYRAFSGRCIPTDLTLADSPVLPRRPASTRELEAFVAQQDVFYVGGGSTLHLLALWRAHGLDRLLRAAWKAGAILAGTSAGMNCWFEASLTDSFGGLEALHDGLGFLRGSACPHYDAEVNRRPKLHAALLNGFPSGYAADDAAALHFVGDDLVEAVASRPQARAYRLEAHEGEVVEAALPTRFLGAGRGA